MDADSHDMASNAPIDQNAIQDLRNEGENLLSDLVDMFIARFRASWQRSRRHWQKETPAPSG